MPTSGRIFWKGSINLQDSLEMIGPESGKRKIPVSEMRIRTWSRSIFSFSRKSDELSMKSNAFNQENMLYHQQLKRVNSLDQEIEFKVSAFESSKSRIEKSQSEQSGIDQEIKVPIGQQ
jgi:chromosome segregation protein